MEPVSVLLLAAVITKMITTHREDVEYARKGVDSPRYKVKLAKLAAAQKQGKAGASAPARPGASGYMKELWYDAWEAANARRERQQQARRNGWDEKLESLADWSKRSLNTDDNGRPVDDMIDVAGVRPGDTTPPAKPAARPDGPAEPEWLTPDRDEQEDRPMPVVHDDQHPYCVEPCGPNCVHHGWQCNRCGAGKRGFVTRAEAEDSHRQHTCQPAETNRPDDTPQPSNPEPPTAADDDNTPLAPVIQLFPNAKEVTMASSEATGLPTAIAFADAAAQAHETFATAGSEGYTNALEGFDVSGEALASAKEAQEASTVAAAKWQAHKEHLEKQLTGQEFYRSNPDAGSKQFLAGE